MDLIILMSLIFLVSLAFFISVLYFLAEAPAADRALRARFMAVQEAATLSSGDLQTDILRRDVLSRIPAFNRILVRIRPLTKVNLHLRQSGMEIYVGTLLLLSFIAAAVAFLAGLAVRWNPAIAILPALGAGAVPFLVVSFKRRRRFEKFQEQFPNAMDFLVRAVRAGHAVSTAFQMIGEEMEDPVGGEFRRLFEQQNVGLPGREALENLLVRVPLPDVHIFVTALLIHSESGGNLAGMLENLSRMIRERIKLVMKARVYTAQGRISLIVLTALPPLAGLALYSMNPEYMSRLFLDPLGHRALAVAAILQLLGYLVIRKIVQPKI